MSGRSRPAMATLRNSRIIVLPSACQAGRAHLDWSLLVEITEEGPMESVGSFEAKTHLPQLLERVAQGEEFTITKHGKPVARLVPATPTPPKPDVRQVIEELKAFSKGNTLGDDLTIRDLIEDGRRF